jgi:glutamate synthase (NADPH/NADH) large chain
MKVKTINGPIAMRLTPAGNEIHALIEIHRIDPESMEAHRNYLQDLLADYVAETQGDWDRSIVDDFSSDVHRFWLIKLIASELGSLIDSLRQAA